MKCLIIFSSYVKNLTAPPGQHVDPGTAAAQGRLASAGSGSVGAMGGALHLHQPQPQGIQRNSGTLP